MYSRLSKKLNTEYILKSMFVLWKVHFCSNHLFREVYIQVHKGKWKNIFKGVNICEPRRRPFYFVILNVPYKLRYILYFQ